MGRRYGVAIGLAVIALALPAVCLANPSPMVPPPEMLPFVLLAEGGVWLLETALIRRWLKIEFWEALTATFVANVASALIPAVFVQISFAHVMLSDFNEILVPVDDPESVLYALIDHWWWYLVVMCSWLVIACVIEIPILAIWFRRYRPYKYVIYSAIGINLISYPVFYLTLLLVGWLLNGVQPATNEWGFPV
ncbi:hypothetical protein JW859_00035 [bacterium]|nr:hypothetical protein [bacterium]